MAQSIKSPITKAASSSVLSASSPSSFKAPSPSPFEYAGAETTTLPISLLKYRPRPSLSSLPPPPRLAWTSGYTSLKLNRVPMLVSGRM